MTAGDAEPAEQPIGPMDGRAIPRFAGPPTFARLPRAEDLQHVDVAVLGVPFDAGTTYRPGARFGPLAIRQGSRLLRSYHPALDVLPFANQQVADAGDISCSPFDIPEAIEMIAAAATTWTSQGVPVLALGGDHTIALPLLRAVTAQHGPVALVHFDAHLDTWDTYFGADYNHGSVFRRAAEEGLFLDDRSMHIGIRGPLYGPEDLREDAGFGFRILDTDFVAEHGGAETARRIRERVGDAPLYLSIDIDVLDPAFAPGTGTPEAGGLQSRELLGILRGLRGSRLVGADIVEVSPSYDHAEITAVAAAHVAFDLLALLSIARGDGA